jgi:hypothetical protein
MFQIRDHAGDFLETPFYFRRVCETCSNTPPNPCHACWHRELILQMRNHRRIWPVNEKNRKAKIEQFAKQQGFHLAYYKQGFCPIFKGAQSSRE